MDMSLKKSINQLWGSMNVLEDLINELNWITLTYSSTPPWIGTQIFKFPCWFQVFINGAGLIVFPPSNSTPPPSARLRDMSSTICINALYKLSPFRNFHSKSSKSAKVRGVVCLFYKVLQFLILTTHSIGSFRICNNLFLVSWIACWMPFNRRNKMLFFEIVSKPICLLFPVEIIHDRNIFYIFLFKNFLII